LFDVKTMPNACGFVTGTSARPWGCADFAGLAVLLAASALWRAGILGSSSARASSAFAWLLGAGRTGGLVGMVVGQGLRMAAFGLAVGAAGAFALTRMMSALLFRGRPSDPAVFLAVVAVLGAVASVAVR